MMGAKTYVISIATLHIDAVRSAQGNLKRKKQKQKKKSWIGRLAVESLGSLRKHYIYCS